MLEQGYYLNYLTAYLRPNTTVPSSSSAIQRTQLFKSLRGKKKSVS
uniref:Uncharacterized protein n=1 Tax=Anguilla anguilla TaxID=7936 RepID=A0A0E9WDI4_ANGAN